MTRGGKRKGAGRPKLPASKKRSMVSIKLPGFIVKWLRSQEQSQGKLIEKALIETYEIERR